jgi:transposase
LQHGTSLLLGLLGLLVQRVELDDDGTRVVHVITDHRWAGLCPACGERSTSVKAHTVTTPKDLPYGPDGVTLLWHKTRWRCRAEQCPQKTFADQVPSIAPGARTTTRLRHAVAEAVGENRSVAEVARSHRVAWPTVQRAFTRLCAIVLGEPPTTAMLGIDETRFGRPRWRQGVDGRWVLVEPWETGFVDLTGQYGLLGQIDGRTSAAVRSWLAQRSQAWRDAVQVVAIDPSAPYAAAVRQLLPQARIAVDHFHLVLAANRAVTTVRQRVTREYLGRRGRRSDPVWVNRRHLLRARERLSSKRFTTMWNACIEIDPSGDLLATWIAKEELRALLACARQHAPRHVIRGRLHDFYVWCADTDVAEIRTLAALIETWWPAVLTFLQTGATNATTEGTNRLIKQVKRQACGFRNRSHYRDRVRFHCTRSRERAQARTNRVPAQS